MEVCRDEQPWEACALSSKRMEALSVLSMQSAPNLVNERQTGSVGIRKATTESIPVIDPHPKWTACSAMQLSAHSIRTAHLVAKNRARNSLRMEGSALKADATARMPSRPTASRCFVIAVQVRTQDYYLSRASQYHFRLCYGCIFGILVSDLVRPKL